MALRSEIPFPDIFDRADISTDSRLFPWYVEWYHWWSMPINKLDVKKYFSENNTVLENMRLLLLPNQFDNWDI